jgi:hypothetical protein
LDHLGNFGTDQSRSCHACNAQGCNSPPREHKFFLPLGVSGTFSYPDTIAAYTADNLDRNANQGKIFAWLTPGRIALSLITCLAGKKMTETWLTSDQ